MRRGRVGAPIELELDGRVANAVAGAEMLLDGDRDRLRRIAVRDACMQRNKGALLAERPSVDMMDVEDRGDRGLDFVPDLPRVEPHRRSFE